MKRISLFLTFFLLLLLSGCGAEENPNGEEAPPAKEVTVQTAGESRFATKTISYPGIVSSEQEVVVVAKASGTAAEVRFDLGDEVRTDEVLVQLENSESPIATTYETAANALKNAEVLSREQVRMAEIVSAQAEAARNLARSNFQSVQESTVKDLRQAEIAREQAEANAENVGVTAEETLRSAEIAYESAQVAALHARETLENRRKILLQTAEDVRANMETTVTGARDNLETILKSINSLLGFFDPDDIYDVDYFQFGSFDVKTRNDASVAFQEAWNTYIRLQKTEFFSLSAEIEATLEFAEEVKILVDAVKRLFEKTNPGAVPQLEEYKNLVNQFQNQVNSLLLQVQTGRQGFENIDLDTRAALDSLERGFELAKKQEELARQNLENVRAGNMSQTDQSSFGALAAANQYEATRIKLELGLAAARTQSEIGDLQHQNALAALGSARSNRENQLDSLRGQLELAKIQLDNLRVAAPISGKVTSKSVVPGQEITAGTPLATISQLGQLKVQFYVDAEYLPRLAPGQEITIRDHEENTLRGAISAISPEADAATKRFLVEARPDPRAASENLLSGTVVSVEVGIRQQPEESGNLLLPLEAVTVGQGEAFVFIVVDGKAIKTTVEVSNVSGEWAEVALDVAPETEIIVEGNKLLQEGDPVTVSADLPSTDE